MHLRNSSSRIKLTKIMANPLNVVLLCATLVYLSLFFGVMAMGGLPEIKLFLHSSEQFFLTAGDNILLAVATAVVKLVEGISYNISLPAYCVFVSTATIVAGLIFDKDTVFLISQAIFQPLSDAVIAIWKVVSKPSNLVSYGIFYLLVSVLPKLPDVILKGQKL